MENYDIHKNLRGWQLKIGFVPQNIYLADCSISENIAFGIKKDRISMKRVIEAAKKGS